MRIKKADAELIHVVTPPPRALYLVVQYSMLKIQGIVPYFFWTARIVIHVASFLIEVTCTFRIAYTEL